MAAHCECDCKDSHPGGCRGPVAYCVVRGGALICICTLCGHPDDTGILILARREDLPTHRAYDNLGARLLERRLTRDNPRTLN